MRPSRSSTDRSAGSRPRPARASGTTRPARFARTAFADEGGSASLEFLTVGLILLVPLVYLVLAVAALQAGALAVEGTARQAARIVALGAADIDTALERSVQLGLGDYGVDSSTADVTLVCSDGVGCTVPGSRIRVEVSARVALPLVPDVLGLPAWSSIPISASATQTVSRFAETAP